MTTAPLPNCTTPAGWARSYASRPTKAAQYARWARQRAHDARQGPMSDLEAVAHWEEVADALEAVLNGQVRCRVCGIKLEDPTSVARGVGPDCWARQT